MHIRIKRELVDSTPNQFSNASLLHPMGGAEMGSRKKTTDRPAPSHLKQVQYESLIRFV
ncbi:hypothetical protein [Albibacterium profundi]|uniref:Transposase n=1 Tax=Albibacterium profundi TaxID=3134906 RepID=A0ABV5CB65_9SPHI